VDLTVKGGESDDPLLARWVRGQGRVAAFMSDADTRWSPEWIRWPGFEGAWAQIVRWTMRPRLTEELFVRVDESGDIPQLIVEGSLHDPKGALVSDTSGLEVPVSMVQTGTWRWQASLEQVPSGWYQLALEATAPPATTGNAASPEHAPAATESRAAVFAKRWVQLGTPPAPREASGQPPLESLLRQAARATAGLYDAPDAALIPAPGRTSSPAPMSSWWLPLVILLLLADVALRGPSMLS
jgi:hypothetical protein